MSLFIHLGAHKTASTHLQRSLAAIEERLLASGIMFLGPQTLRGSPLDLRALLNDRARTPPRRRVARVLMRELLADHRHMIISEELILGGLKTGSLLGPDGAIYLEAGQRLQHLLDLLGTQEATFLLALREPADFLTSLFTEQLRQGGAISPEDFLGGFDPAALSWSGLVGRLLASAGHARILCWRYEDIAAVRSRLLARLLGPELAACVPDPPPLRVGLSDAGYRMVRAAASGALAPPRLVQQAFKAHPVRRGAPPLRLFTPETRAETAHRYDLDCAAVAALPRVEFLRPVQPD